MAESSWPRGTVLLAVVLSTMVVTGCPGPEPDVGQYEPNWESLARHKAPQWFHDAKLGIFIHWGVYSVPGWAPVEGQYGELTRERFFQVNPYAEWYMNSMRIPGSPPFCAISVKASSLSDFLTLWAGMP